MKRVLNGELSDFPQNNAAHKLTPAPRIDRPRAFRFNPLFCNDLRRLARLPGALGFERVLSGGKGNPIALPSQPEAPAPNVLTLWSTGAWS